MDETRTNPPISAANPGNNARAVSETSFVDIV